MGFCHCQHRQDCHAERIHSRDSARPVQEHVHGRRGEAIKGSLCRDAGPSSPRVIVHIWRRGWRRSIDGAEGARTFQGEDAVQGGRLWAGHNIGRGCDGRRGSAGSEKAARQRPDSDILQGNNASRPRFHLGVFRAKSCRLRTAGEKGCCGGGGRGGPRGRRGDEPAQQTKEICSDACEEGKACRWRRREGQESQGSSACRSRCAARSRRGQ
mmetsp:Transcript_2276/g.5368  ORF Transcript_2276/g.5368 Transcript_2276/m.5368 type:complete len:212 (-) Transcript_2276:1584-2219(-)